MHVETDPAPTTPENLPASQEVQSSSDVAIVVIRYVPAGHPTLLPVPGQKYPAGHGVTTEVLEDESRTQWLPALAVHVLLMQAPAEAPPQPILNWPDGQSVHEEQDEAPGSEENLPASQA